MKALILGPHAGNGSISTYNYFSFYASQLPACLPDWRLESKCPSSVETASSTTARLENFVLWPIHLLRVQADLLHIVDQGLAWYSAFIRRGRRIITVHDLISYMTDKALLDVEGAPPRRRFLIAESIRYIQSSEHIICVSECTANHVISLLGIPASKITVIPNVLESHFSPLGHGERSACRRTWFGDAKYVVIHVGKASSYKNRIGALRAFDRLYRRLPDARMFLVHGEPNAEENCFLDECESRDAIQFLPKIARSQLREFYGAADVLIFPSHYEGFGWPPLEAMASGCPVVCTTRGALKEVVGDAALTVNDPRDYSSLSSALLKVLKEDLLARDLRSLGLERAKMFSPAKLLHQMAEVYRSTCRT